MTIQEIEQELFEMERKLKSMFNSCSQDLAVGIEKLRGALAELKESKKEGKWKPTYGDEYWLRDDWGNFRTCEYCAGDCMDWRLNNVPLFPTKEECERYWHFMDTVKEKSYEFSKEEWEDVDIDKYFIYYRYKYNDFDIDEDCATRDLGKFYFKTREDAQYIIDNFKDELMEWFL